MNIRNADNFSMSFWDWTFLNDCFAPTNIRVSDIDGIVERNGHFLVFETKAPGSKIERGQERMHDALLDTGKFAVLLIWGDTNAPDRYLLRYREGFEDGGPGLGAIHDVVCRWFKWADKQRPERVP